MSSNYFWRFTLIFKIKIKCLFVGNIYVEYKKKKKEDFALPPSNTL